MTRHFFFACSFTTLKGGGNLNLFLTCKGFPSSATVIKDAIGAIRRETNIKDDVSVVITNFIEMNEDDFNSFNQ
jgi:hypothetical protein